MSTWRQFTRGLRTLFHRNTADRDIADEVDHYLEQSTADAIARGLSPAAARRHARLHLNPTAVREQVRSHGSLTPPSAPGKSASASPSAPRSKT